MINFRLFVFIIRNMAVDVERATYDIEYCSLPSPLPHRGKTGRRFAALPILLSIFPVYFSSFTRRTWRHKKFSLFFLRRLCLCSLVVPLNAGIKCIFRDFVAFPLCPYVTSVNQALHMHYRWMSLMA